MAPNWDWLSLHRDQLRTCQNKRYTDQTQSCPEYQASTVWVAWVLYSLLAYFNETIHSAAYCPLMKCCLLSFDIDSNSGPACFAPLYSILERNYWSKVKFRETIDSATALHAPCAVDILVVFKINFSLQRWSCFWFFLSDAGKAAKQLARKTVLCLLHAYEKMLDLLSAGCSLSLQSFNILVKRARSHAVFPQLPFQTTMFQHERFVSCWVEKSQMQSQIHPLIIVEMNGNKCRTMELL